ncbi:MAG TPA: molybdopterin-dependent oxidoreductase [Nitrolancea sp.]|nr:molybdopterin-dependent oxidoreductase [Nitrolancea sp.]
MNRWTVWLKRIGIGLLAGLTAALVMTAVMALLRLVLGISPPAELLGDRIVPTINVREFIRIIIRYGGPEQAKEVPIKATIAGQLAVGAIAGLLYSLVVKESKGQRLWSVGRIAVSRRGVIFASTLVLILWAVSLAIFWPVLESNYLGIPPQFAGIVTAAAMLVAYVSYGVTAVLTYHAVAGSFPATAETTEDRAPSAGRRSLLVGGVGAVAAVAGFGMIRTLYKRSTFFYDGRRYHPADAQYIVPADRFYLVTKNVIDPVVHPSLWRLEIDGLVEHPHTYGFDELTALTPITQDTTLECISNQVGDGLISNAQWTGVPLRDLLNSAVLKPGIKRVLFRAVDGYTDTIPLDKALDPTTLVAYRMNGQPLPHHHGYPVRIIVPGRFGEKNVKWITRIEPIGEETKGYYESQGWGPTFIPATLSRFDFPRNSQTLKLASDLPINVRGIASAGDRGITRVEVSVDNKTSWQDATLDSRGSKLTWRLWSFAWSPVQPGDYHLWVRATDGSGAVQTVEHYDIVPDGSSGFDRATVHVV